MKTKLTAVLLVLTASMLAQTTSTQTTTTTTTKPTRRTTRTSPVAEELKTMRERLDAQQQQIQQLQQELQRRDEQMQQLSSQSQAAAQQAEQARTRADAAASATTDNTQAVNSLQSTVSDLKSNATNVALSAQEEQKRVTEMVESPLTLHYKGVTITPGGFLAAESVWRQHGTASDVNTPFNSIPFPGSDAAHLSEFFGSGRQSRVTLLVEGKLKAAKLSGYYETDWLSAGITSNNNQSNSYTNRQRQLWGQAALDSGWTITGGQMWSLVTETKKGLDNRSEALPMTIDAQYHVGFSWTRQFGFRVVKSFANKAWLGFSMENPQTLLTAHGNANNFVVGAAGTGGGLYNSTANYSLNYTPDFVVKAAFEPGFGHYEVFGIVSNFRDRIYPGAGATPATAAGAINDTRTSGGIGANARVSIKKHVDIGVHFLGGNGVGRYGTSTLPDATVRPDGTLALIRAYQTLATIEWHSAHWDWYANGGGEYAQRTYYLNATGKDVGYGAPGFSNSGCGLETVPTGGNGFLPGTPGSCTGDTRNLVEGTLGFWYKAYNGPKGRVQFGPQFSYVVKNTWAGTGGAPHTVEPMVFTSFRYYLP
jgi:hypothetical protein